MKRLLRISFNSAIFSLIPILSWFMLGLLVDKNLVNVFTLTYPLQFIYALMKSIFATGSNISKEKDKNENIKMIKSNVIPINEIISDVALKIQNKIDERGRENIEIALGSFTGFKLLAGKGPGVKIRISSIGNVETDLRSEFISQGINQTLHRVYLQVKCKVNILTPFDNIEREITNQVLLVENVIVGNIPNTYYNLEGLDSKSDALEIIE